LPGGGFRDLPGSASRVSGRGAQPIAQGGHRRAGDGDRGAAGGLSHAGGEIAIRAWRLGGAGEGRPLAGFQIAFRRQPLGQQQRVARQFHVPIDDPLDRLPRDGGAVDQVADRDQDAIGEHRVVGR